MNLTKYVTETNAIIQIPKRAETGFVLQTGVAPGFVSILGHMLYKEFQRKYRTDQLDLMEMKVGAIPQNASVPHFLCIYLESYWSCYGVCERSNSCPR